MAIPRILITSDSNPLIRLPELFGITLSSPDTFISPNTPHLGIDLVRAVKKFVMTSPSFESLKIIIIYPAQHLTLAAQNAFLKTLEEPPPHAQIYLIIENQDQLLPTILSRCEIKYLPLKSAGQVYPPPNGSPEIKNLVTAIDTSSIGKRLILTDAAAKNRESALLFCTELINYLHTENLRQPSRKRTNQLKNTQEAITHLLGNANPRLTLQHLFIHW